MAVQIRSKRKKNFKSNEGMQFEQTASLSREVKKDEQSSLNVRRSSRKPKPKKLSDDFEEDMVLGINIKQEPLDEDESTPTVYMTETPVFDTGPDPEEASFVSTLGNTGVRRETRKSFQNYLETLGYNRDFSKISAEEQQHLEWQARKNSGRKNRVNVKSESRENIDQSKPQANKELSDSPSNASSIIQASSRTTRPKKTFGLSSKQIVSTPPSRSGFSNELKDVGADDSAGSAKRGKTKVSGNERSKSAEQRRSRTRAKEQSTSTPLSTNEVEVSDVMSDEIDGTPTRTSGRIRIPKRQFSLLEDESQSDAKRQKITPDHIPVEEKKRKQKESITPKDDQTAKAKPSLVVKRSNVKKGKKKHEPNKKMSDSCPGKVKKIIEDINIKREVDTSKSSQSETEKKTVVKKGRERIEKIVETLLLAKQSDLATSSKEKHPEEKIPSQKKGVKRKRESTEGTKKNNGKKDGLKKAKKNTEEEHIVLKLHIPHEKDKDKTKKGAEKLHHKHHHHHKHKKSKQGETVVKKLSKSTEASKASKKVKANGAAKKTVKKMKLNIKQEPDDDTHPHVKLIIKKSPNKSAKIAEVMMQDMSEPSTDLPDEVDQDNKEKVPVAKQNMKKKLTKKKYKSLAVKPLPPRPFRKYWKAKARAVRMPNGRDPTRSFLRSRKGRYDSYNWSHFSDVPPSSTGTEAIDMAAYLKLLGESLCSIGMCLKRQDQMEVHGSLSVLLDTALCSIVPVFCLTSQIPELAGCSHETQAQILENLAYIIPGL
ncbi:HMG box-containing protein 4-like isoform X2 [Dendronephthya gigantea]|uniref:HMG box-containing protein 4-like isoform X2 n=1 Tax=Dendronephthya gigantea TaxID=151771 RepID=UPI00106D2A4D|nr:HMG box-containing protein 4-like isoform X2 [Dendronephthya gigantea]